MNELEALAAALYPKDAVDNQKKILGLIGWAGEQIVLLSKIKAGIPC